MNRRIWTAILGLAMAAAVADVAHAAVLVELFTSEGCSSCPPADALLGTLEGQDVIVLSEHVDYWNEGGWKDPFSSAKYTQRQQAYASRLHVESPYTPQMIVDGTVEFVGGDKQRAKAALELAAHAEKVKLRLIPVAGDNGHPAHVRVEVDPLPASLKINNAEVYVALAANEETSQVLHGENGGRRLHHVAVVRSLNSVGKIRHGSAFTGEISLKTQGEKDPSQLRVVAFVQEQGQGRVLGVAMRAATP